MNRKKLIKNKYYFCCSYILKTSNDRKRKKTFLVVHGGKRLKFMYGRIST